MRRGKRNIIRVGFLVLATFLLIPVMGWAQVFYVDAGSGSDANSGLAPSTAWKTIAKVNATRFNPGDRILFECRETWRETLRPKSGGEFGNPIVFASYGIGEKPIISGSDRITGSLTTYSSYYCISFPTNPRRVWWGTRELIKKAGGYSSLGLYEFDYVAGNLVINIGRNPTGETIEATRRDNCLLLSRSYITVNGLWLTRSNKTTISHWDYPTDRCVIENCLITRSGQNGIYSGASSYVRATYWTIQDCVFEDNGVSNIYDHAIYTKWAYAWTIQRNTFKDTAAFGINLNGSSNCAVKYNFSKNNYQGFLEFDEDTAGGSMNNIIQYNVSIGGLRFLYQGGGPDHSGNLIYNNTAYAFTYGGICVDDSNKDLTLKNNIFWSSVPGTRIYRIGWGCSITNSSNNDLGPEAPSFISYQTVSYNTLTSFKAKFPGLEVHSISANPLFLDSASDNLDIPLVSPCKDIGTNLSLTRDFPGQAVPYNVYPDAGAYEAYPTSATSLPPQKVRVRRID